MGAAFFKVVVIIYLLIKQLLFLDLDVLHQLATFRETSTPFGVLGRRDTRSQYLSLYNPNGPPDEANIFQKDVAKKNRQT
ncbi:hypothetical protein DBX26_18810 [Vibrio sp. dhg]|nr:hypothetical protein DBX26_18810 [Vibrio sp. dhg]